MLHFLIDDFLDLLCAQETILVFNFGHRISAGSSQNGYGQLVRAHQLLSERSGRVGNFHRDALRRIKRKYPRGAHA